MKNNIIHKFNKEIYRLKLTLTTKCILRCRYCFVKKNNRVVSYPTAITAITFFINSPGNQKLLDIYGGEPFLYFDLLKKIIKFAKKEAIAKKKSLIISVATNGLLLNQKKLDYLRKTGVNLAISLDGQKKSHDLFRVFKNGSGSFNKIAKLFPLIFKNIKKNKLCILFGVSPSSSEKMYENLIFLVKSGFTNINIEIIKNKEFKWGKRHKEAFSLNFVRILKYFVSNIRVNKFLFLSMVNRELNNNLISERIDKHSCPFFKNLEVYPHGELAFSALLINSRNKNKYIIGNVDKGIMKKYRFCKYSSDYEGCGHCWRDYGKEKEYDSDGGNTVSRLRDFYSVRLAQRILNLSQREHIFKEYIQAAKMRI